MKKIEIYFGNERIRVVEFNYYQKCLETNCMLFLKNHEDDDFDDVVAIVPFNYLVVFL